MKSATGLCREPTITEMLSDPIVKAVMQADGIDPAALEAELQSLAQEISARRYVGAEARSR
jgi:hypothetical protein